MIPFLLRYSSKFVSRWFILLMDIVVVILSFTAATIIRFNFDFTQSDFQEFLLHLPVVILFRTLFFLVFKTHRGIIRHTSFEDAILLFKSVFSSTAVIFVFSFTGDFFNGIFNIPRSIIVVDFFILLVGLMFLRLGIKTAFEYLLKSTTKTPQPIMIYGAGLLGITAKNTLLQDKRKNVQILCFIDDNPSLAGKTIEGIEVISRAAAFNIFRSNSALKKQVEIILAIGAIERDRKNQIIEAFLERGIRLKSIPPAERWINGELSANQIENIKIEDLLDRDPIQLNDDSIRQNIFGKRVFITGAAGSIGSEIVRQVLKYRPDEITLIDQGESALYDLETELKRLHGSVINGTKLFLEVGDVTDKTHLRNLFACHKPHLVFHAAAYKHVPLMENSPYKAFKTNVIGTKIVADLSSEIGVEKFVLISTDKAVNPTNVMGASKRMAEIYVQSLNAYKQNKTQFIVTRFGNVLGSNGSVIPLFKKQIESGGPVTVTHKDIIRYFMTIPEACQLVLEAGVMGQGGEIFVFDMGEPVKIYDLARKMIQLSGFVPNKDIEIQISGLREGEKLFEELLGGSESEKTTHHPKIKIAKQEIYNYLLIKNELEEFGKDLCSTSNMEIVGFLKSAIPEYISNNSIYELLDHSVTEDSTRNP